MHLFYCQSQDKDRIYIAHSYSYNLLYAVWFLLYDIISIVSIL